MLACLWHKIVATADLPATAECLVGRHEVKDNIAFCRRILILLGQYLLLGIKHPLEAGRTFTILDHGKVHGMLGGLDAISQVGSGRLCADKTGESVLYLAGCLQYGVLVINDGFFQTCILNPHVIF